MSTLGSAPDRTPLSSRSGLILIRADLASGDFAIESVDAGDWLRIAELVAQYGDLALGTVDASVVAAAKRLGITQVATLDRRHFSVVRPSHVESFELVPHTLRGV